MNRLDSTKLMTVIKKALEHMLNVRRYELQTANLGPSRATHEKFYKTLENIQNMYKGQPLNRTNYNNFVIHKYPYTIFQKEGGGQRVYEPVIQKNYKNITRLILNQRVYNKNTRPSLVKQTRKNNNIQLIQMNTNNLAKQMGFTGFGSRK